MSGTGDKSSIPAYRMVGGTLASVDYLDRGRNRAQHTGLTTFFRARPIESIGPLMLELLVVSPPGLNLSNYFPTNRAMDDTPIPIKALTTTLKDRVPRTPIPGIKPSPTPTAKTYLDKGRAIVDSRGSSPDRA